MKVRRPRIRPRGAALLVALLCVATESLAQPTTIATGQGSPGLLLVDTTNVYWVDSSTGHVRSTNKNGGGVVSTYANRTLTDRLPVQDSQFLYYVGAGFNNGHAIYRVTKADGTTIVLDQTVAFARGLVVSRESGRLYYTSTREIPGSGRAATPTQPAVPPSTTNVLASIALSAPAAMRAASAEEAAGTEYTIHFWDTSGVSSSGLAALAGQPTCAGCTAVESGSSDGSSLYYTGGLTIWRLSLATGAVSQVVTRSRSIKSLLAPASGAARGSLFWIEDSKVMRRKPDGTVVTVLADVLATHLAVDGDWVYVENSGLVRVSIEGGNRTVLANDFFGPVSVALDATHIYWTSLFGKVSRIPRPDPAPVPDPINCTYAVTATPQEFAYPGGTGFGFVEASAPSCQWPAGSDSSWAALNVSSGTGSSAFTYTVAANDVVSPRVAILSIAGRNLTITQGGAPLCSYQLSATKVSHAAGSNGGTVTITAPDKCPWTATSNAEWVKLPGAVGRVTGRGTRVLSYTLDPNTTGAPRTTTLVIAGKVIQITQLVPCAVTLSATGAAFPASGGTGSAAIKAGDGCGWTAAPDASFVTLMSGSGSGDGPLVYSVASNPGPARTAKILVGDSVLTIVQAAAGSCAYTVVPETYTALAAGDTLQVVVNTNSDCTWPAASLVPWMEPRAFTGSGFANPVFTIAANDTGESRSGHLSVAGKTITVTQPGRGEIRVVALEVVQTIQDWNNSIPLIAGKPTFVRVHVEPVHAPSMRIANARLRGRNAHGTELGVLPPLDDSATAATPHAAQHRERFNASVNFQVPPDWTMGEVHFEVQMDRLIGGVFRGPTVTFQESPGLDLRHIGVLLRDDGDALTALPSPRETSDQVRAVVRRFPLKQSANAPMLPGHYLPLDTSWHDLSDAGRKRTRVELLNRIETLRLRDVAAKRVADSVIYFGSLRAVELGGVYGVGFRGGGAAWATLQPAWVLAHEIAHTIGEVHPVNTVLFGTHDPLHPYPGSPAGAKYVGSTCSVIEEPLGSTEFPYGYWLTGDGSKLWPRIGPSVSELDQVFGLDLNYDRSSLRVVGSGAIDFMMGHACGEQPDVWTSKHTYERLLKALQKRFPAPASNIAEVQSALATLPYVAVRGLVNLTRDTAEFLPFSELSHVASPPPATGGTHLLVAHMRSGEVHSVPFTPSGPVIEEAAPAVDASFVVQIPGTAADIVRVEVKRNDKVLVMRTRTNAAPVVQVVSPAGGTVLDAPVAMEWTASDADGDGLRYEVQFSADAGQSWRTLAMDWPTTRLLFPGSALPATTNAVIRIQASDGVNLAIAQSAPFTVNNHAPTVTIVGPTAGSFFGGDVPLAFEAIASDVDDESVAESRITWTSNLGGTIGTGSRLERRSSALAAGTQIITVRVVDSAGAVADASVQVTIARQVPNIAISTHPANQLVGAGEGAAFTVVATASPAPAYQWQASADAGVTWSNLSDDSTYAGVGSSTLSLTTAAVLNGYRYRVVVSNASGTVTSRDGTLTVVVPKASLDHAALAFAATSNGAAFTMSTPSQTILMSQVGQGLMNWTATSNRPWLKVSPASGVGAAVVTVSVAFDSSVAAAGTATGAIALNVNGTADTTSPIDVSLTVTGTTAAKSLPFGVFDTPSESVIHSGSVALTGWTLDNIGVKRVELWRSLQPGETTPPFASTPDDPRHGKIFIGNAVFTDGARPDVESLNSTLPFASRAGWGYLLLTQGLWDQGNGVYFITAYAFDEEDNISRIGTKVLSVNNRSATKPFGAIDTPAIGGDPGTTPNFGWALTPKVNGAATCKVPSNGVQVSIDSGPLQPVVYGDARSDIAGAFPGLSNSAAAGGHFIFDWSTLANGTHTIGWLVTDDCGRADGIGSRFFNVMTGNALKTAPAQFRADTETGGREATGTALLLTRGYGGSAELVAPDETGTRLIETRQLDRIELRLPRGYESALQLVNGQVRALPIGSTWDAASNTFYWEPAPGFLGRFRFVFSNGRDQINVRVTIVPRGP